MLNGGRDRIRTCVRSRGQIYSLLPLTTRPPFHQGINNFHSGPLPCTRGERNSGCEEKGKGPLSQEQMKQQHKNSGSRGQKHGQHGQNGGFNKGPQKSAAKSSRKSSPSRGVARRETDDRTPREQRPQRAAPRIHIHLYGIHAVEAALNNPARTIHKIYVTDATEDMAYEMIAAANKKGFDHPAPVLLEKQTFERAIQKGSVHQGIGLDCDPLQDVFMPDIINKAAAKDKSVIVLLDQVTDPHNLGAVIRSACAFGADAIIVQSRHAPELNAIVAKTASGAMEHLPVVYETNLARAIESLQEQGYFALALDERGEKTIAEAPKYQKTLLVLGAEGPGLRPLIRDKCDILVKLPTAGALSSLNVSNAAAVSLYAVSV